MMNNNLYDAFLNENFCKCDECGNEGTRTRNDEGA